MSGEVSRSRQKKAAAPPAKKAQNGTNGGSTTSKSSNWNKENKKKSKDRKNKQNMASPKKSSQSGFLCSTWTLVILLTLTGISVASYHQYPEKVQAVLDVLPPQVCLKIHFVPSICASYFSKMYHSLESMDLCYNLSKAASVEFRVSIREWINSVKIDPKIELAMNEYLQRRGIYTIHFADQKLDLCPSLITMFYVNILRYETTFAFCLVTTNSHFFEFMCKLSILSKYGIFFIAIPIT